MEERNPWNEKSAPERERLEKTFVRGLLMAAAAMAVAIVIQQTQLHAFYFDWNDKTRVSEV